jgi:hypothetical protein
MSPRGLRGAARFPLRTCRDRRISPGTSLRATRYDEAVRATVLSTLVMITLIAQSPRPPRFSEYAVKAIFLAKRTDPHVSSDDRDSRGWRAVLADANKPANFAGRYVISQDTCGSDSVWLMITDAGTGQVFQGFCLFWDYLLRLDARWSDRAKSELPSGLQYRRDSALLVAHGCWDDDVKPDCGDHYYRMTSRGLIQVRFIPFGPPSALRK